MIKDHLEKILKNAPYKIVLSKPSNKSNEFSRININRLKDYYQLEKFTDTKVYHENIQTDDLLYRINQLLNESFRQLHAWDEQNEYSIKLTKKGKAFFNKKNNISEKPEQIKEHNKKKNYLLAEGQVIEPLVHMGIFSKDGYVKSAMHDKYRQINRFLEIIDDAVRESNLEEFSIIDFGCGKSYLTFILYYYFAEIKNIKATIIGVDQNEELVNQCNEAAKKYGYSNLHFEAGDINGFTSENPVDMVISLHACDTATDYAIKNAIDWNAKMIFAVPCCQHELNDQIDSEKFRLFTRYGLTKERFAALITDTIRANLLEYSGYKTQILEFIDMEHTPKNILIRAIKKNRPHQVKEKALKEVETVIDEFNLNPTLYELIFQK